MRVFASKNETTEKEAATEPEKKPVIPEKKQETTVDLVGDHGMYYYTKMYLGSKMQELKVAFSTASTVSVINSNDCDGCKTSGFDYLSSFSIHKVLAKHIQYLIGGSMAEGVLVQDDLKLDKDSGFTARQFPFLLANEWKQSVFEKVDGVIGLSRQYLTADGSNSGSALLDALYDAGQIEKKVFSVNYGAEGSQLLFGGYNSNEILPGHSLKVLKTPYAREWQVSISAMKVGNGPFPNGAKSAYSFEPKPAYLDSFSPYIQVPKNGGSALHALILHDVEYELVDGLLMGPCDKSKYRSVSFLVNDKYFFELTPESFVLDIGQGDKCLLPFVNSNEDYWVLGEPFFRNYYSVYDVEKGLVGVAPSVNAPKAKIYEGKAPADILAMHNSDAADARKGLPSLNDPFSVVSYVFDKASSLVLGKPAHHAKPANHAGTWTCIATILSLVVLACSCCCLCAGCGAYLSYQGNRFMISDEGMYMSGKPEYAIKKTLEIKKDIKKQAKLDKKAKEETPKFLTQEEVKKHLKKIAAKKQKGAKYQIAEESSSSDEEATVSGSVAKRNPLM